jgi:outer membrane biosynthesis protein TonB
VFDYLGFFIAVGALVFMYFKKKRDARLRAEHPDLYATEEKKHDDDVKEFLRSMNIDVDSPKPKEKKTPAKIQAHISKPKLKAQPSPQQLQQQVQQQKKLLTPTPKPVHKSYLTQSLSEAAAYNTDKAESDLKTQTDNSYDDSYGKRVFSVDLSKSGPAYDVIQKDQTSKVQSLLANLHSKKEMVIIQEIMGPPKGLPRNLP